MTEQEQNLKISLEDAISEAVSMVSYDTNCRFFVCNVKAVVEDGWTKVETVDLKITE